MVNKKRWIAGCGASAVTIIVVVLLVLSLAWRMVLGPDTGQYFDSEGVRIYYRDQGEGTPVLLVHGFAGSANLEWRRTGVMQAVSQDYRVIALDNRGHGRSDKPHDPDAYGVQFVEDLVRLLDHLEIDQAHLVGYSMGGFITLKFVVMYPERLLSAAPCAAGWEQLTEDNMAFGEVVAHALETGTGIGPLGQRLGVENMPSRWYEKLAVKLGMAYFNDPLALAAVMRGFHKLAVSEAALEANQTPTLTVMGSKDGLRQGAEELAAHMANHELLIIEGKDHFNTLGTTAFLERLRRFLLQNTPR